MYLEDTKRSCERTPVGIYLRCVVPLLTELAMRNNVADAERGRWVPLASGVVLEVGVGSGLNFAHYGSGVRAVYALDPSAELRRMAARRVLRARAPVEFLPASAEDIPLPAASVDTVLMTWTLCTIGDPMRALGEIGRVLGAEGRLVFVEHGRAPDPRVASWQQRVTPLWRRLSGGCHLDRPIDQLIEAGGFEISEMERGYVSGPRIGAYFYRGVARLSRGEAPRRNGRAPSDDEND